MNVIETVYILEDPRSRSRAVRWVGRTRNLKKRLHTHRSGMTIAYAHNPAKARWMRELRSLGLRPRVRVLAELPTERARIAEEDYIAAFRAAGHPLFNVEPGRVHSAATREKIARAHRGRRNYNWRTVDVREMAKLHRDGLPLVEIASRLGVSMATVHRRLRAAGVKTSRHLGWRKRQRKSTGVFAA